MALPEAAVHDRAVSHRIALTRYSNSVVRKMIAQLNRTEQSVVGRLQRADNETVAGQRLEQLLTEIRALQTEGWSLINARMDGDLTGIAAVEIAFTEKLVEAASAAPASALVDIFTGAPALVQVMAAVKARPFQGRVLKDFLAGTEDSIAARIRDTIRQGFIDGSPTADIVRTLRGTAANGYKDGLMEGSRRGVEAMTRTAITHTANVAQQATYKALGVERWRFVATLDSRTTLICAGLNGQEFKVGTGPQPPRHWGCRSTTIPVTAPIPGVKPFEFPSYQTWLKGQPAAVQDDILGVTKARLFRSGALSVDRFTDKAGRVLTLSELRARDALAFEKAGLH